ncbi:MAG: Mur ligase family protein, partial [Simkaniaceae bacterium]|nr:Mur ligase family protein [Simkaniaceae bacterium]
MQYAVDSRDVEKGSLFFALKGERSDGHCFLEEVKKRGAAGAVISDSYEGDLHHLDTQRVKNVLFELQEKARKKLEKSSALRIGITGSVGKTTTSNFLKTLLSEKFSVTATIKSFNGQIGLPLTILNGDLNVDVLVLELGMNLPGEMARLVEIAPLDYALVTMISESHVGNFEGLDEVAKQKGMVFTSKRLKKGFVSRQASAYFPKQEVIKEIGDSPFQADHLSACFFAAAHVARALGLSDDEITRGAKKLKTSPRRFERCEKKGVVFINDS